MLRKSLAIALPLALAFTTGCLAVSVGELAGKCGDDGKKYCEGVRYGQPMQDCLDKNYQTLEPQCKAVMDRLRDGESVTLF